VSGRHCPESSSCSNSAFQLVVERDRTGFVRSAPGRRPHHRDPMGGGSLRFVRTRCDAIVMCLSSGIHGTWRAICVFDVRKG